MTENHVTAESEFEKADPTTPRSSSNRSGSVCDAVLARDTQAVGPVRMPINRADDFIDQFNRTYASLGMTLSPIDPPK